MSQVRDPGVLVTSPESFHFFAPKLHAVLVAIPKNGCSTQKEFMLRAEGLFDPGWEHGRVHAEAKRLALVGTDAPDRIGDAARIITIRDPLLRVASAFRNKLVRPRLNLPAASIIESHARIRGVRLDRDREADCAELGPDVSLRVCSAVDYERGLTFREFVETILELPDEQLDPHWRPQSWFFGTGPRDRLVPLGQLSSVLANLASEAALQLRPAQSSDGLMPPRDSLTDEPSGRLAAGRYVPGAAELFDPHLIERVLERYAQDAELLTSTGEQTAEAQLAQLSASLAA